MIEIPEQGRAKITDDLTQFKIEVPVRKNWIVVIFLCFWLCGWLLGEVFALTTLLSAKTPLVANLFMLVWLTGWTIGGLVVFSIILWQLTGKEVVTVESKILIIEKKVKFFKRKKMYDVQQISNLRSHRAAPSTNFGNQRLSIPLGKNGGKICFDYGMKTVYFLNSIEDAEAGYLLEKLRQTRAFSRTKARD
ncbi:MAG: hypothetical protein N4A41_14010 [Crocinitomicaceae bacterium]|jgi:hypothetical protein|nr:hypothetical protein [Crocinitomicaceae bacterium]